ncbi:MAG: hypothetical protein Q4C96_00905 [Planctomycetia bacterium]|nr:hypothetical protein [Planctomycetia bacterium]
MLTTYLFENPFPILIFCMLMAAFFCVAFNITRYKICLLGALVSVLMGISIFLLDFFVITAKERVRLVIQEGVRVVESQNEEDVFKLLSPEMKRSYAPMIHSVFRNVHFEKVRANDLQIYINELTSPHSARAEFFAVIIYRGKNGNVPGERLVRRVSLKFEKYNDEKWLISGFEHKNVVGDTWRE